MRACTRASTRDENKDAELTGLTEQRPVAFQSAGE